MGSLPPVDWLGYVSSAQRSREPVPHERHRDRAPRRRHRLQRPGHSASPAALGTHMEAVDEVAGLPVRYTSKLMSANNQTSLGRVSLGPLLGALALKLAVVPDQDALARVRHRLLARDACGRGPSLLAGSAAGLRRARKRRDRELAAALMRLRSGATGGRAPKRQDQMSQ
jgi:hypothetical protein